MRGNWLSPRDHRIVLQSSIFLEFAALYPKAAQVETPDGKAVSQQDYSS